MPETLGIVGPFCVIWVVGKLYTTKNRSTTDSNGNSSSYILFGACESHLCVDQKLGDKLLSASKKFLNPKIRAVFLQVALGHISS